MPSLAFSKIENCAIPVGLKTEKGIAILLPAFLIVAIISNMVESKSSSPSFPSTE